VIRAEKAPAFTERKPSAGSAMPRLTAGIELNPIALVVTTGILARRQVRCKPISETT
jgi:hypothetical protein